MDNVNLEKMRDDIYKQLRAKYEQDPESLSDGLKAILAIMATTRYFDKCDTLADHTADMYRRLLAAEKMMDEVEAGTFKGPGDYVFIMDSLVTLDMAEAAEEYTELYEMAERMHRVMHRCIRHSVHEYERSRGEPLSELFPYLDEPTAPESWLPLSGPEGPDDDDFEWGVV